MPDQKATIVMFRNCCSIPVRSREFRFTDTTNISVSQAISEVNNA